MGKWLHSQGFLMGATISVNDRIAFDKTVHHSGLYSVLSDSCMLCKKLSVWMYMHNICINIYYFIEYSTDKVVDGYIWISTLCAIKVYDYLYSECFISNAIKLICIITT